jgi:hypothetical protein
VVAEADAPGPSQDAEELLPSLSASETVDDSELEEVGSEELAAMGRPWADLMDSDEESELVEVSDAELAALGLPVDIGI